MSPQNEPRRPLAPLETLVLLAVVLLARILGARFCHLYDDAFITFRYAGNLAGGLGMVFNPGASWEPVLGTTTPGYTALLAGCIKMGFEAARASLTLNLACDVASAWLLVLLLGRDRLRSTLVVCGFALMPELTRVSMGGMEAPVLCLLVLAATWCLGRNRIAAAGTLAAFACTVRPEALIFIAVLLPGVVGSKARLVRFLTPIAIVGASYTILLIYVYGSPIPHSVTSKAQRHGGSPTLATWLEIARQGLLPRLEYLPALPFVLFGWVRAFRFAKSLRPLLLFALGILLAYLAARPHTWGWYYYLPLVAWVIALAFGLEPLLRAVARRAPALARVGRLVAGVAALALLVGLYALRPSDPVTERVYRPIAEWAHEVRLAEQGAVLLASDIGAIGYYGRSLVLDSEGLTCPPALEFSSQVDMVVSTMPEYLLLTAVRAKIGPMRANEQVARGYYPIRRFSRSGATELEPRLEDLPDHWVQDYILYRRRL
ncbi:MAG: hypothetical protein E2O39_10740 [Planctomycetota bacterium]|nr:MAG: hypothetical protein E2O39_10740 [Planctomycetota bacterium]